LAPESPETRAATALREVAIRLFGQCREEVGAERDLSCARDPKAARPVKFSAARHYILL